MLSVTQAHKLVDLCGIISELFLDQHPVIVFVNSAAKVDTIFKVKRTCLGCLGPNTFRQILLELNVLTSA